MEGSNPEILGYSFGHFLEYGWCHFDFRCQVYLKSGLSVISAVDFYRSSNVSRCMILTASHSELIGAEFFSLTA